MATIASESGHWYDKTGTPQYQIVGKNGKTRNTTLRDAKEFGYVPSVTTITKLMAAPGLTNWIIDQNVDAALTLPRNEGESLDDFRVRVKQDAKEQGQKAMALGTEIHGSLEKFYKSDKSFNPDHVSYVNAVQKALLDAYGIRNWEAESSFASKLGYGGKIDLFCPGIMLDFKTSAFSEPSKKEGFDEQLMQLSAYAHGVEENNLDLPTFDIGVNVFISTTVPGLVKIWEWDKQDMKRGWEMFDCLRRLWQLQKGYIP